MSFAEDDTRIRNDIKSLLSLTDDDRTNAHMIARLKSELERFTDEQMSNIKTFAFLAVIWMSLGTAVSIAYPPAFYLFTTVGIVAMASIIIDVGVHLRRIQPRSKAHYITHTMAAIGVTSSYVLCSLESFDTGYLAVYTAMSLGVAILYLLSSYAGNRMLAAMASFAIMFMIAMSVHAHFIMPQLIVGWEGIGFWEMLNRSDVRLVLFMVIAEATGFIICANAMGKVVAYIEQAGPMLVNSITQTQEAAERFKVKQHTYDYFLSFLNTMQNVAVSNTRGPVGDLMIAGSIEPSKEISGDFYDIVHHEPSRETLFWIGDVSGKGVNAGMVMVAIQSCMRMILTLTGCQVNIVTILGYINSVIYNNFNSKIDDGSYMSTMSIFSYRNGRIMFTGEHENVILLKADGDIMVINTGDFGSYLGLYQEIPGGASAGGFSFEMGDSIVLYSDGLIEQRIAGTDTQVGTEVFTTIAQRHSGKVPGRIHQGIMTDIRRHAGVDGKFDDDVTLVVIGRWR